MPIINKKKLRARITELSPKSNEELEKIYLSNLTDITKEAIERIFRGRKHPIPEQHGSVTEDETVTHIITLDDLKNVKTEEVQHKSGMGWTEGISFVIGVGVIFLLARFSYVTAAICGAIAAVGSYTIMRFSIKFWRELGMKNGHTLDD